MKKHLAICSIIFSVCAAFTSCGDSDNRSDVNNDSKFQIPTTEEEYESNYEKRTTNDIGDYAGDVIDGVEDAGEDIIDGAGDAAEDVIDGVSGNRTDKHEKEHKVTTTTK